MSRLVLVVFAAVAIALVAVAVPHTDAIAAAGVAPGQHVTARWCGALGEYTTWYRVPGTSTWKPILYVWKGKGRGNPYAVSIYYTRSDGRVVSVPNTNDGIRSSSPQVDPGNGWVGYFISTRWRMWPSHWQWDDDWRWDVRGCLP